MLIFEYPASLPRKMAKKLFIRKGLKGRYTRRKIPNNTNVINSSISRGTQKGIIRKFVSLNHSVKRRTLFAYNEKETKDPRYSK